MLALLEAIEYGTQRLLFLGEEACACSWLKVVDAWPQWFSEFIWQMKMLL